MSSSPSVAKSVGACLLYAMTSMTISMTNKMILSQYNFGGTFILLSCQLAGALLFVAAFKTCNSLGVGKGYVPDIPAVDVDTLCKAAIVALLFVGNVACAFFGLRAIDVPMFLCVRRLTTICVILSEFLLFRRMAPTNVLMAVGLIMMGTLLAGHETLSSNYVGYVFVMSNNVLTAMLYIAQKKFIDDTGIKSFGLLYYNALIALPLSLCAAVVMGEFEALAEFKSLHVLGFQAGMLLSSGLGVLMTYATVLCNSVNSPLATSITGNTKDILSTVVGWMLFGGFAATVSSVSGLLVSFAGSGWYSAIKLRAATTGRASVASTKPSSTSTVPTALGSPDTVAKTGSVAPARGGDMEGARHNFQATGDSPSVPDASDDAPGVDYNPRAVKRRSPTASRYAR